MRVEYRFTCGLHSGLHARPASLLAESVQRFVSDVTLAKEGAAAAVDLRSVLSVVGLDVVYGEVCVVVAEGPDAAAVIAAVRALVEGRLGDGEEAPAPLSAAKAGEIVARLPVPFRRLGLKHAPGRAVSGGVGMGFAVVVGGLALPEEARRARAQSVEEELEAARRAIGAVREGLRARAAGAGGKMEGELLRAHAQIADDPALWAEVEGQVRTGATAAQAVAAAAERLAAKLRAATSAYIRDRAVDVQDVCMQILDRLMGGGLSATGVRLERESVVFAETLTANQLLGMDRRLLKGLVLGGVGATAHTVILARSMRVPTLIDVRDAAGMTSRGEEVVVDGEGGFVLTAVGPEARRYYEREEKARGRWLARVGPKAAGPAMTRDGARLEIGVNASGPEEVAAAVAQGADGVGLLRTELLFLDRVTAPSEEEQLGAYSAVVRAAAGRPVIIRTFDIGGDKPATYLTMPREENPFLGVRGLRLYESHPELLMGQLRAVVRASGMAPGCVKVMAPMVASPQEAAWFRERVREAQAQCRSRDQAVDEGMAVGIMIEIPAAALVMDQLAEEVDFFSLGTNDLCQYWMAVDRGNPGVAGLYNPRQPSFVRLLHTIVSGAKARGKWIGVCGEMAGDPLHLPLMLGLGVDEISVAPGAVLGLKMAVREAEAAACREVVEAAAAARDVAGVEGALRGGSWRRSAPSGVVDAALIELDCEVASKEEAIRAAVDLLYVAGRTERPREVEEAVWAREEQGNTEFINGFAIPHCKTEAVASPSLALVRMSRPVDWGAAGMEGVGLAILLATPSASPGEHLKMLAKLSRKLMHEEFRGRLMGAADAVAAVMCLKGELGLE